MVQEVERRGKTYYLCSVCQMAYLEREWAQKCEEFCVKYKGCSIEIIQHAVTRPIVKHRLPKE